MQGLVMASELWNTPDQFKKAIVYEVTRHIVLTITQEFYIWDKMWEKLTN